MPRKPSRKATGRSPDIRTVAALARVSIATVSRTINGAPVVSEKLSKRVWQAIHQLGYLPNTHARTLVSGRSRLFGIIVENIGSAVEGAGAGGTACPGAACCAGCAGACSA